MLSRFSEIWFVDFEFEAKDGECPRPICVVAREYFSRKVIRLFEEELWSRVGPPYGVGKESLVVGYFASAELGCHLALNWPLPVNVLDLYVEFRTLTNGLKLPAGRSLSGALQYFGLDWVSSLVKDSMRQLALRGGPWNEEEKQALLVYCESDVTAVASLFDRMLPQIDLPRALLRGRSMKPVALMESAGIPVDVSAFVTLRSNWKKIQDDLIAEMDRGFGVYEGRSFRTDRFQKWVQKERIPWPRTERERLALDKVTFKQMALRYPQVAPLANLRSTLSQIRKLKLTVGSDGRNRALLSPFASKTGRNQPSTTKFIFGLSAWSRGLIQAAPGRGVAYIDWCQQEFGIAAALSRDRAMQDAYASGDPYLAFARQAGAVPPEATKNSHSETREQFKQCALAVLYGMGTEGLAARIGQPSSCAQDLIRLHRKVYHEYWTWSDAVENYAMLHGKLHTVFGWNFHITSQTNPRTIRNFPMQANGAEMLRLACCLAGERGVTVCAPVHDAVLIESSVEELPEAIEVTRNAMAQASACVLGGFVLRTDFDEAVHPQRLLKKGGTAMWNKIWAHVDPSKLVADVQHQV
jgi:DNA polymerase-1